MESERLVTTGELRAEGRTLHGVVMQYGEVGDRNERFVPGSLNLRGDTWVDVQHNQAAVIAWRGHGAVFTDTRRALTLKADLPRIPMADRALEQVKSGALSGLSIEFVAKADSKENQTGTRVITEADLLGVGIVDKPSYGGSVVEVRQRTGRSVSGRVALGSDISCRCRDGCDTIRIEPEAFDVPLREAAAGERRITAFFNGSFDKPLAAVGAGLVVGREAGQLAVRLEDLPETQDSLEFLALCEQGQEFQFRPYFPDDQSTFTKDGTTAIFTQADLRGIEIAPVTGPTAGIQTVSCEALVGAVATRRGHQIWL